MADDSMGKAILACMGFGALFFGIGIKSYFKKRLIENTPTSKVRSIAMGFVELYGAVVPTTETLTAPFTGKRCVYYHSKVQKYVKSKNGGYWHTIRVEKDQKDFFLKDDTGKVLIASKGATLELPTDFTSRSLRSAPLGLKNYIKTKSIHTTFLGFGKRMRYIETYIAPNDKLFIMGTATERPNSTTATNNEDRIIIKRGKLNKYFFISDHDEKKILNSMKYSVPVLIFGGFALFILGLALLFYKLGILF